jgi:K+:H+ antiporter
VAQLSSLNINAKAVRLTAIDSKRGRQNVTTKMLLGLAVLLLTASAVGTAFRRIRQPTVIGQIVGGVLLGPTLLGAIPGNPTTEIFGSATRLTLDALGQVGVVCYVFTLGLDMDLAVIRSRGRLIGAIACASMFTPLVTSLPLGMFLYRIDGTASAHHISQGAFVLFIGLAFSITAVPVLACIIQDRRMANTHLARATLASAILQDLVGWLLLAVVLALVKTEQRGSSLEIALIADFGVLVAVVVLVRALVAVRMRYPRLSRSPSSVQITALLGVAALAAAASSAAGLQPIIGAVLCGVACARGMSCDQRSVAVKHMRPFSENILLPAYFLVPGLGVNLRAIGLDGVVVVCGMVAFASVCKICGASLASRACGLSWQQSGIVGVLMNARGLVELVLLRIGYTAHLLSNRLYGELLATAVITTLMTGPLLSLITEGVWRRSAVAELDLPALTYEHVSQSE